MTKEANIMAAGEPRATLADSIYANIRRDITERRLLPGEKINIKELADRYGASQTPVKLALHRLVSENVVENFPRQGMTVKLISPEEIGEIFDMRLMLDLYKTKEVITFLNYDEDTRNRLLKNIEEHLRVITSSEYPSSVDMYLENYRLDREFHEMYLKCTGCVKLVDLFNYIGPYRYVNYIFRKQSHEKDEAGVLEHRSIMEAIMAEDEDALRKAVTTHLVNAKRAVELIIKVNKII
jgi:DNA-binding GntR family transcriptional regulator